MLRNINIRKFAKIYDKQRERIYQRRRITG